MQQQSVVAIRISLGHGTTAQPANDAVHAIVDTYRRHLDDPDHSICPSKSGIASLAAALSFSQGRHFIAGASPSVQACASPFSPPPAAGVRSSRLLRQASVHLTKEPKIDSEDSDCKVHR